MDFFTRQTSSEAYRYLIENDILGKRQLEVYTTLYRYGALTANEVFNLIKTTTNRNFRFDSNTRARFTELRNMDLIEEMGTRVCSITGRKVILWQVTNRMPKKLTKSIEEEIARLDLKIAKLQIKRNKLKELKGE
jgi:hypothetical protein